MSPGRLSTPSRPASSIRACRSPSGPPVSSDCVSKKFFMTTIARVLRRKSNSRYMGSSMGRFMSPYFSDDPDTVQSHTRRRRLAVPKASASDVVMVHVSARTQEDAEVVFYINDQPGLQRIYRQTVLRARTQVRRGRPNPYGTAGALRTRA